MNESSVTMKLHFKYSIKLLALFLVCIVVHLTTASSAFAQAGLRSPHNPNTVVTDVGVAGSYYFWVTLSLDRSSPESIENRFQIHIGILGPDGRPSANDAIETFQ